MTIERPSSRVAVARLGAVALVVTTCTIPEARAATALAQGIMSELMALARPAFGVGIAWIGYLVAMGRGSLQLVVTFLIGAAIVFAGGHLS